jgi:hypothetical protein
MAKPIPELAPVRKTFFTISKIYFGRPCRAGSVATGLIPILTIHWMQEFLRIQWHCD